METTNYLQSLGGHCFICHTDYSLNDYQNPNNHTCSGTSTPCRPDCSPEIQKMAAEKLIEKDKTIKDRLKAIEVLVGGDYGLDAEWYSHFEKRTKQLSREKLEEFVIEFGKIITNVYVISHGGNSECCKGKGKEIVDLLLNETKRKRL